MEHDGPNVCYGRCQGKVLLFVWKFQSRHGTLAVSLTQRRSRVFCPNRQRGPSTRAEHVENPIVLQYVLPDFSLNRPGQLLNPGQTVADASWQILEMNHERFTVPELLFTPSDIGMFFAPCQINECDANRRAE